MMVEPLATLIEEENTDGLSPSPRLPRCHCNWPPVVADTAREGLRAVLRAHGKRVQKEDIAADIVLEHVWNVICDAAQATNGSGS